MKFGETDEWGCMMMQPLFYSVHATSGALTLALTNYNENPARGMQLTSQSMDFKDETGFIHK